MSADSRSPLKKRWTKLRRRPLVAMLASASRGFIDNDTLRHAAALAFYTALSLAPLVVILLWILGLLGIGGEEHLVRQVELLVGTQAGEVVRAVIESSQHDHVVRGFAGIVSVATLAFSASGVFSELQGSLNKIWNVEIKPGLGILGWLRKRLTSFAMLGALAFLLLVSLTASAGVSVITRWSQEALLLQLATAAVTVVVYALLFATIFKVLPDVRISWRDVIGGASLTAGLFALGKWAIGAYLARHALGSAYGAASSLVVVLMWVYFSSVIALFGAELAQAWASARGRKLAPNRYAVERNDCAAPPRAKSDAAA